MKKDKKLTAFVKAAGWAGKLGPGDLTAIIKDVEFSHAGNNVVVGLEHNDDAGVFRMQNGICLVQTADFITPVVDDPFMYGRIAAANSLSDVYAMGGKPLTALNLVCFDSCNLDSEDLKNILKGGQDAVKEAGAVIIGGHTVEDTEMKYGLSVTGSVKENSVVTNSGARAGDKLVLTKPLGLGIITTANKADMVPAEAIEEATSIMAELNRHAAEAMVETGVNAATDITGFGLIGHALEIAQGSDKTLVFNVDSIPFIDEALNLASMGLIPAGSYRNKNHASGFVFSEKELDKNLEMIFYDAQTSGGLLISVSDEKLELLIKKLQEKEVSTVAVIGEVKEKSSSHIVLK